MHFYSIDSSERKWIPLIIALVSIPIVIFLRSLWDAWEFPGIYGELKLYIGFIIDLSVIFFYDIFFRVFDEYLWKCSLFSPIVKAPNLNGKWKGKLDSSHNKTSDLIDATMEITQTWQNIEIRLKTKNSRSKTVTAAFFTKTRDSIELSYQYQSNPNPKAIVDLHIHKGTGWIILAPDQKSFEGGYYNGRDNKNHGSLKFERVMEIKDE